MKANSLYLLLSLNIILWHNLVAWSFLQMFDISSMPVLLHIVFLTWLFLRSRLMCMMVDKFLEFLDPDLVKFEFLFFLLQDKQLPLLVNPLLHELPLNGLDLLAPTPLRLLPLLLQFGNLFVKLADHLISDVVGRRGLGFLGLLFVLFNLLLHLFYLWLLRYVDLVVFAENPFVLKQLLREVLALLFWSWDLLFQSFQLLLVLVVVSHQL